MPRPTKGTPRRRPGASARTGPKPTPDAGRSRPVAPAVKVSISQARTHFARVLAEAGRGRRILLDRHGKGVAAIVPVEDLRLLCELDDFYDARAARAARDDAEAHGTVPWDELRAELEA